MHSSMKFMLVSVFPDYGCSNSTCNLPNKVVDRLVDNDKLLYDQDIKNVTMKNGTISLMRNDGNPVENSIVLTGNGGKEGKDTSVTVTVGKQSQTFQTGSVVTAEADDSGNATKLTINGNSYGIKAGKHTTLSNGKNTTVNPVTTADGHLEYKVDVNDELKDIKSIIGAGEGAGSISFANDGIKFNNKVTIDNTGKISGVANGIADNDAVNVSQLNKVSAAAKTEVVKGTNIASVVASNATDDGHTVYTVNAKGTSVSVDGNFNLNTTTDDETNVTNYGISLKDSVTIGGTHAVTINGTDGTVTGLTNTTWNKDSITSGRAATEDQLQAVATEAGKHTTLSNGKNTTVESTVKDGQTDYKVNVAGDLTDITSVANGDSKINLNKDSIIISNGNKYFAITNSGIGMSYIGADYSAKSIMLGENGTTISGGLNVAGSKITGVAAGEADTDAVNVSQLKKVSDTANAGWNLSTNGVATEATNVKPGEYVDFSGDKNISVSHDGTNVKVELNKNIDVNSVQTNALNSKYNLSVGTMAENGIMPFLVNSTGAFYAANNNFSVDKDGKVIATAGEIGNVVLKNGVYTGNSALRDGELYVGDADGNYSQITTKGAKLGKVTVAEDGKISGVAAGVADTDAVNVGQLKEAVQAGNTDTHIKPGEYGVGADNKVNMDVVDKNGNKVDTVTIKDVAKASDVGNVNNIASDIKNQDGSHTTVVDAVNNLNQKLDNKVGDLNYVEGGKGNYVTNGENTTTSIGKLDQALKDVAATAAKHTTVTQGDNITVTPGTNTDGSKNYNVALKKDITVESVTANTFKADQTVMNKDGLKVGNKVSVSATAVTAGKTSISDEGVKVGDKTYISDKGLNANEQKVTNVDAGELSATSKDAVNGSQLYETNQAIANNATNISSLSHSISNLDNRVNKVGAGAAALAALHPLDFDPDAKWDFAAGYGNYRGANAAAVGAYYRPNEDTMFSVGGTFGNGENMVNAGVSFKLGSGSSHVSTSRVAMAKEIKELRGELEAMKSAMLDANAGKKIDTSKLQLFPDVPQNHWAYEYVAQLAGNGMIEGYPDGNFAGDRPMTRYEFAAILYRAMTKGAVLSDKILSEFSHELEYFTVDTIAKDKAGNPTIQRVRTVKENKNK